MGPSSACNPVRLSRTLCFWETATWTQAPWRPSWSRLNFPSLPARLRQEGARACFHAAGRAGVSAGSGSAYFCKPDGGSPRSVCPGCLVPLWAVSGEGTPCCASWGVRVQGWGPAAARVAPWEGGVTRLPSAHLTVCGAARLLAGEESGVV